MTPYHPYKIQVLSDLDHSRTLSYLPNTLSQQQIVNRQTLRGEFVIRVMVSGQEGLAAEEVRVFGVIPQ